MGQVTKPEIQKDCLITYPGYFDEAFTATVIDRKDHILLVKRDMGRLDIIPAMIATLKK